MEHENSTNNNDILRNTIGQIDTALADIETTSDVTTDERNQLRQLKEANAEYFKTIDFQFIDLAKIPSLITLTGIILSAVAARDLEKAKSLMLLTAAYLSDNLDGAAAKLLHQESDAGALFDVVSDKLKNLIVGVSAYRQNVVPKPVLLGYGTIEATHVVATTAAKFIHKKASLRPPQTAKYSMFFRNVGVASFIASHVAKRELPDSDLAKDFRTIAVGATVIGLLFEIPALKTYFQRLAPDGIREIDDSGPAT